MVEAQAVSAHRFIQRVLAGVTERRVADVVHQSERFRQVSIQPERSGNRTGKLRHLDGVRKTAAVVIRVAVGKNLRLAGEPPERARVNDAGAVSLKGRTIGVLRLRVSARGQGLGGIAAHRTCGWQWQEAGWWVLLVHARAVGRTSQCLPSVPGADSRASFTLAFSSFFCTLLTSLSSTSAGMVRAYCASD